LPRRCAAAAHRCQIGQQRHAGEVLQHHARNRERNLFGAHGIGLPAASCSTCSRVIFLPSQLRSTDSSTMRIDTGRRATPGNSSASAGSEKSRPVLPAVEKFRIFEAKGCEVAMVYLLLVPPIPESMPSGLSQ
jgi:hypothetical protein